LNNNDSLVSQCSILRDGFGFLTYFVRRCYWYGVSSIVLSLNTSGEEVLKNKLYISVYF
jgi:hypothetical protein